MQSIKASKLQLIKFILISKFKSRKQKCMIQAI